MALLDFRIRRLIRAVTATLGTCVVVVSSLLFGATPAAGYSPNFNWSGQLTPVVFTGIWGFIGTSAVTIRYSPDHTSHWMGKSRADNTQWAQTGWDVECTNGCGSRYLYLEYKDYGGASQLLYGLGQPSLGEDNQFAVWGDASGGSDGIGPYFNTYINVRSGPNSISPTWVTRLTDLWLRCDINGEVYNTNGIYNEPMGNVEYGWNGYAFIDLAVWNNGTTWALWDSQTTPQLPTPQSPAVAPYTYSNLASPNWSHFQVGGGGQ